MQNRKIRVLTLLTTLTAAPAVASAGIRAESPNQISLEAGGRAVTVSVGYERWLSDSVGLGLGLGLVPCIECASDSQGVHGYPIWVVPLYLAANLPFSESENHGLHASAGVTLTFPDEAGEQMGAVPSLGVGYQLLTDFGFTLRPYILLFFNPGSLNRRAFSVLPWAGLQLGWAF